MQIHYPSCPKCSTSIDKCMCVTGTGAWYKETLVNTITTQHVALEDTSRFPVACTACQSDIGSCRCFLAPLLTEESRLAALTNLERLVRTRSACSTAQATFRQLRSELFDLKASEQALRTRYNDLKAKSGKAESLADELKRTVEKNEYLAEELATVKRALVAASSHSTGCTQSRDRAVVELEETKKQRDMYRQQLDLSREAYNIKYNECTRLESELALAKRQAEDANVLRLKSENKINKARTTLSTLYDELGV